MQTKCKVVNIPMTYDMYISNVSKTTMKHTLNYNQLKKDKWLYEYVKTYDSNTITLLKNNKIDYVRIYADEYMD